MWTKSRSVLLSRIMIYLFLLVLLLLAITLPSSLGMRLAGEPGASALADILQRGSVNQARLIFLVCCWASVIPAFFALLFLHQLLRNIENERVFIPHNVQLIRRVSWCCFLAGAIYLGLAAVFLYITGLLIGLLLAFTGLILRVIKNVFAQAIAIKEEYDLTI